ncbi:MAG: hypothetical protein ACRDNM_00170 [Gaiellaceae bacterium]
MPLAAPTANDAAAALVVAYQSKHPGEGIPNESAIELPLAQLMGEGSLSRYFAGTNNLGAMHATANFAKIHAADKGFGMVAFLDHGPGGAYITRMSVYPSLSNGARALLDLVERMVDLPHVVDVNDFATQLYVHGYYTGFAAPVTPLAERAAAAAAGTLTAGDLTNIDAYARLISANLPAATAALHATQSYPGDPSAVNGGPPFAALAERLTPSRAYAPHTLEHARTLLGDAAVNPPAGAISLDDALAAPGGDGVWLFGHGGAAPSGPSLPAEPASSGATGVQIAATVVGVAAATALGLIFFREARVFQRLGFT